MPIIINGYAGIDMDNTPVSNSSNVAQISNLVGFKNLLINPNFVVNQISYVSGTNTTVANQYAHDMWRIPTIGQNVTFTTINNVTTVTAPSGGYEQVIENINVQSGDYKISHEGTATISVAESTDNVTYTTLTINANGTYTLTGGKYVRVRFSSGTIIKPQVELGSVRTPFENRPVGLELSLCQRYYEVVDGNVGGYGTAGQMIFATKPFTQSKRVIPSMGILTLTGNNVNGVASVVTASTLNYAVYNIYIVNTGAGNFVYSAYASARL